jgi:hypothetical protein
MQEVYLDYDSAMFVEYELREGAQSAVTDKVLDKVEGLFWDTEYENGLFAITYDGDKKIKLVVPYKKAGDDVMWVGIALGKFMNAMDNAKLVDFWVTTVNEEEANRDLQYNYTGYFEELEAA